MAKVTRGWVEKRISSSGTPRFRARCRLEESTITVGTFDTEAEAWEAIEAFSRLMRPVTKRDVTLAEWGARWLDRRELSGIRSIRNDRSRWRAHIADAPFINWPLKRIQRKHVAAWARDLIHKKATRVTRTKSGTKKTKLPKFISRQTAKHVLNLLRCCLGEALEDDLIKANPARDVRVPRGAPQPPRWAFLTTEEIRAITTDSRVPQHVRDTFTVLIYTGMRLGEAKGLRWEDVDLNPRRPHLKIRRSYRGPPKTAHAIRGIPLLNPARASLARLRELGGVRRLRGLVWPRPGGGCRDRSYDFRFRKWRDALGLRPTLRPHDLRHTCASHLVMGTWGQALTLLQVKAWLGHSSAIVTERYAHLSPDSIQGIAAEMDRNLGLDFCSQSAPMGLKDT